MTPNLSSSFLSFPTQSSPRLSIHRRPNNSTQTQTQNLTSAPSSSSSNAFRHISYPHHKHRPTPIDLYALPTLEALPTPPSTSSQSHVSFDSRQEDQPRRLKKAPSQGELTGRVMRSFTKKRSDKEKEKDKEKSKEKKKDKKSNTSFLPFDTDPPLLSASRRPSAFAQQLPKPPTGMATRSKPRPAPLDPAIFGHRIQLVKAEDPIDMVLRLDSEARVQAITRSFSPFGGAQAPPPRPPPPPLDPSVFGTREVKVVRSEDPIGMVLRLDEEHKMNAMTQSFTPFGNDQKSTSTKALRSRGESVGQGPDRSVARVNESRAGSVRQRDHGTMPSIQGVIEGDDIRTDRDRRDTMKLPMMAPPPTDMPLRRSPTSISFRGNRDQAPSPTSTTPREYFYPRPESPRAKRSGVIEGFTNRSPPSRNLTVDESPTLGSIHLPEITRVQSFSPSTTSQTDSAWQSNTYVDPDEERLTALEILEELNGGMEDGWEFGVLDTQRIQAGLDNRNFKEYGMTTTPYSPTTIITAGHHRETGSIKEVANSVRSWRESRKKVRPPSEKSVKSKTGSLKPKPSYDGLQPVYGVHYSMDKEMMNPPPIPPRAPGRSLPPLKIHIERVVSSGSAMSAMEVPIVLDSPVKSKVNRKSRDMAGSHDIPESVILSPPTSPTPIQQRPLPPLPGVSPRARSLRTSLEQADSITRLLRPKRPNTGESSTLPHTHHSTPPAFTQPLSPLDSPPPASPRPRLSAREEPHASLPSRDRSFSVDKSQSRKHGMTALSFLALEDPTYSWADKTATSTTSNGNERSLDGRFRRESVQAHIMPPEELAKLATRRRASSDSDHSRSSIIPEYYTEALEEELDNRVGRMSFGLSPPPRHNRRSPEPPPRVDEEEVLPSSLSPPPRPRHSLSTRRPSDSPSTHSHRYDYLQPAPASPYNTTPSPSQSFMRYNQSTPSPIKESTGMDVFGHSPSELGHASELRQGSYESSTFTNSPSASKEMDKQALNEWLSKPRVREGSAPVQGISRRRGMLV